MTNPMMPPTAVPVAMSDPRPTSTGPTHPTGAPDGAETGGCSNCGSVHSVRVLPGGRHRCACGHRWTCTPRPTARPAVGHTADGTP